MKKLALVLGAAGFLLTVGAAGGADSNAVWRDGALCGFGNRAVVCIGTRLYQ